MSEFTREAWDGHFPTVERLGDSPSYAVGSIVRLSVDTWKATFPVAFVACLLLGVPQKFVSTWCEERSREYAIANDGRNSLEGLLLFFAGTVLSIVVSQLMVGWMATASYQALLGRRCSIGESLAAGFRSTLLLLGASARLAFGCLVGLVMLIVPGILFFCVYGLIAPIVVCEGESGMGALNRSADLTRGGRLRFFAAIFGLAVVLGFPSQILGRLSLNIMRAVFGSLPAFAPTLIEGVFASLFASLLSQVPIVAWFLLRRSKECVEVDAAAVDSPTIVAESPGPDV